MFPEWPWIPHHHQQDLADVLSFLELLWLWTYNIWGFEERSHSVITRLLEMSMFSSCRSLEVPELVESMLLMPLQTSALHWVLRVETWLKSIVRASLNLLLMLSVTLDRSGRGSTIECLGQIDRISQLLFHERDCGDFVASIRPITCNDEVV